MNFSFEALKEAKAKEKGFSEFFLMVSNNLIGSPLIHSTGARSTNPRSPEKWTDNDRKLFNALLHAEEEIHEAFCNNFDTPSVIVALIKLVAAANIYVTNNSERKALLLRKVSGYVANILKVLGLVDFNPLKNDVLDLSGAEGTTISGDRDTLVFPYVKALADFRTQVRNIAKETKQVEEFKTKLLGTSDKLRDEVMPDLGVRLEDSGATGFKLVDRVVLLREKEEEKRLAKQNAIQSCKKSIEQLTQKVVDWEKKSIPPHEAFLQSGKYSSFDADGLPTHDDKGNPLPKSAVKKVQKDKATLEKHYKSYIEQLGKDAKFLEKLKAQLQAKIQELQILLSEPHCQT